jgi:hypothetical protein
VLAPGVDYAPIVQGILFALFALLSAILAALIGPTYDNLLVPELRTAALYPSLFGNAAVGTPNYLARAAQFSTYLLANVVDPAVALIALGVAVLFLAKSLVARWGYALEGMLPRLVLAVIGANFTVPIAAAVLDVAGAAYPVFSGWDGGAWTHWVNLAGWGEIGFSTGNGALTFLLAFVEFAEVLGLVLAVGVRDALLAVLIVLLPIFTLLWPIAPLAPIARRAWFLFLELAFLPCVLVVPLELAVGTPSPVLLVAYLGLALASPFLLSLAGTHLVAFGAPAIGGAVSAGTQRGLSGLSQASAGYLEPAAGALRASGPAGRATAGAARAAGSAAAPAAAPLAATQLVGHGALHLVRHLRPATGGGDGPPSMPPIRPGAP